MIWRKGDTMFYKKGVTDPDYCVLKFTAEGGRYYLGERVNRLLVPFLFGTIVFMPIMSYIGDKFSYSYNEGFLKYYIVFFTKYTDLTGADGGFSVGQFWFLLYLLIISIMSVGILTLLKKVISKSKKTYRFGLFCF